MKYRKFALLLILTFASLTIIFSACKKINEATDLGDDLIPAVDNITTFETNITNIETYNNIFELINDSTRAAFNDEHFLGRISNDPVFGATDAEIYVELKPPVYPYAFRNVNLPPSDSLFIDSVVLVMDYIETYGDSLAPQQIQVSEITSLDFKADSSYFVNRRQFNTGGILNYGGGPTTIIPARLKDSVKAYQDTTARQMRIRLDDAFGKRLLDYDSATGQPYSRDSLFRDKFKGFALKSLSGNAIMGFDLQGANTKLAIYYKYRFDKTGVGNVDTAVNYFTFTAFSANANYIKRTYTGAINAASGASQDPLLYMINSPGTYAMIKIPALDTMSNKLIHRAELIMEQVADPSDTLFAPPFLFLDAYDAANSKYWTIPYDLQADISGNFNLTAFGTAPQNTLDPAGKVVKVWKFNVSRYVQHILTTTMTNYQLRVFAPYHTDEWYGIPPNGSRSRIYINPSYGKGRVRLGGGNHPTQRMRLRLVYSKI